MKGKILATRNDGNGKCYLCSISLDEYTKSIPETYQKYDIQREIVSNVYLDHLVDTVIQKRHIPSIVLVVDAVDFSIKEDDFEINKFKILDGLQRTFRLRVIKKTVDYCIEHFRPEPESLAISSFKLSRQHSKDLRAFQSNTAILRTVLESYVNGGIECLSNAFVNNIQWFEVWVGLTLEDEIRKMLMLNAGHKPVTSRHQLELLFLNVLPFLREKEGDKFVIYREKEISASSFSKSRKSGQFHFAHIITTLLSLYEGKPVAPSTDLIQGIHSDVNGVEQYGDLLNPKFLRNFIRTLAEIDQTISEQFPERGAQWLGREVTISGIFGAIGAVANKLGETRESTMARYLQVIKDNPNILDLNLFEDVRNSLDLSKVNFGNVNRRAIFDASVELLGDTPPTKIDWEQCFRRVSK